MLWQPLVVYKCCTAALKVSRLLLAASYIGFSFTSLPDKGGLYKLEYFLKAPIKPPVLASWPDPHLTQLDSPLVEAVDVPDGALREREVLVVDNERAQLGRTNVAADQHARRGPVSKEDLVGRQVVRRALSLDLLHGLADHQGLGLRKIVGGKHLLVQVVGDGVVRLGSQDEVGGNQLGALVDELEERVLGVGAGLAEEDGTGRVLGRSAVRGGGLAVGLHGELLEVGGEAVEILVETVTKAVSKESGQGLGGLNLRSDQVCLGVVKVAVPDTQETTDGRDVVLESCRAEVLVHLVRTSQELLKVVVADVERDGEANCAPDGVPPTDPALETEHVLAVDAELGDLGFVGGQGHEVLRDVALATCLLEEPALCRVGVGGGLSGGEGLGGDQEEGCLGVSVGEGLCDVGAVNVGHKVQGLVLSTVVLKGLGDHDRTPIGTMSALISCISMSITTSVVVVTARVEAGHVAPGYGGVSHLQVRSTNTNIDNGGQLLACEALPLSAAHLLGELLHVSQDVVDATLGSHDIHAIDFQIPRLALETNVPQSSMVYGTVLGEVDLLAIEHGVTLLLNAGLGGQLGQEIQGVIGQEVLGEVEDNVCGVAGGGDRAGQGEGAGELFEALGVRSEGLLEHEGLAYCVAVLLELTPRGKAACLGHCGFAWGG
ncbi:hypothetical protein FJTKL_04809 [Diaporthe vaccinii]|uniref:Uncharacterized protein n=1 Tax=Diaporthe vaccinii TaxID=105482 RepID=A0ABR4DSN3_9PEZI